jgi:hypothetical protein
MKVILLRGVTTFCLVDICHHRRTNRLTFSAGYWNTNLCYKARDGGLIWNISRFQHKKWLVTTQNKESVRYHEIFYNKNS